MAPRASWKGYLKLSLVSCPVRLYPATSTNERVRFNQLHKDTHNRINMKPVDPELGLVERSDLVKGYEYEDKKYIIIDDGDLEAVKLETNHTLNIEAFVDADEVDVIYQDTPYYLAPDGAMAEETFTVLREAMREAGKLAIARLVMSSRERVVTIAPREKGMFVCTLRAPNEVRATSAYFDEIPDAKPDPEMLQLAEALIEQKAAKFDPKAYEDRYEAALMAMIKEKLKGHKPIIAADPQRGNVVNLMDALKASLGQAKPAAPSKSKAPAEEKPAAKAAGGGRRASGQGASRDLARRPDGSASSGRCRRCRGGWRRGRWRRRAGELRARRHAADHAGGLRARAAQRAATREVERRVEAARAPGADAAQRERVPAAAGRRRRRRRARVGRGVELLDAVGAGGARLRASRALRRVRAGRRAVLLPRPDPGAEVCRADRRRRGLGGDRALGAPVRAGGVADGEGAAGGGAAGDLRAPRRRGERARRADAARARGRGRRMPTSSSPAPRRRRRRGGTPRRRRSTRAASRSIPATRWRRSTGPTACGRPGRPEEAERGAGAGAEARSRVRGGLVQPRRAGGGARARGRGARAPEPRDRARPGLCRCGLQPREARVRRRRPAGGAAVVGCAIWSSTRSRSGRGQAARGIRFVDLAAARGTPGDRLSLRRAGGRGGDGAAGARRGRADGFRRR